ncbi:MAG: pantetheine-phosphate adenylyltransferase [Elusimicrobia bacterium]|nr:pantetheine-phosphate adenylyltransferase [Elusimicrobiota bacterium]
MKKIAVYPGSFDPITYGHLDVIKRASIVFDDIIVAVIKNPSKKFHFTASQRIEMIKKALKEEKIKNVKKVDYFNGLLVEYMKKVKSKLIIRGLRAVSDFDYEFQMALMNRKLMDVDTVFFMTDEKFAYLSSSLVREIAFSGGNVTQFVPRSVAIYLKRKGGKR